MASWPSSVTSMPGHPAAIDQAFGGWASQPPTHGVLHTWADIPAKRIVIDTPDKENGVYLARQNIRLRDERSRLSGGWPITCWAAPA
jgi:hypothetical protein